MILIHAGIFSLAVGVDTLFFIGSQLVALSQTGKVGIWHAMTQNWQVCLYIYFFLPVSSHIKHVCGISGSRRGPHF